MKYAKSTDLSKKARKMLLTINNPNKDGTIPSGALFNDNALLDCLNGNEQAKAYIVDNIKEYIDNSDIIKGKTNTYYCFSLEVGETGQTPHIHIFFNFENPRFGNKIKKVFPTAHIDYCSGSSKDVRNYVFKCGKWEGDKKEDTRIDNTQYENRDLPEEKGQGERTDLEVIKELIDSGLNPQQILDINPNYYRYETIIRKMYFDKRKKETPVKRDIEVIVHIGVSRSGKSHAMTTIPESDMFIATDYSSALLDNYCGEPVLFMDEFRGQIPYNQLLTILDGYKVPCHARYDNVTSLWSTIHMTSVIPPEEWYNNDNIRDTYEQLKLRITKVVFHLMYDKRNNVYIPDKVAFLKESKNSKDDIGYTEYMVDCEQYTTYADLEKEALLACKILLTPPPPPPSPTPPGWDIDDDDPFGLNNNNTTMKQMNLFEIIETAR